MASSAVFWWSMHCTTFLDQPAAMHELARALAPGGRLVIEEPDIHRPAVKLVALAERIALMGSTFWRRKSCATCWQRTG